MCIVKNLVCKLLVVMLSVLTMSLTSCKKVKEIRVTSVAVEAIAPQGLQGLNVFLAIGIDNPAFEVGLEDIRGALKHSGKVIGRATLDPFVLQARSAEIYHLKAFVSLGEDATVLDLLKLADMDRLEECMADVSVKLRMKGTAAVPINIKDIPLKKLLESTSNEKN